MDEVFSRTNKIEFVQHSIIVSWLRRAVIPTLGGNRREINSVYLLIGQATNNGVSIQQYKQD